MKENPRMIVANGTKDARVLLLLNIRRQTKIMPTRARQTSTASNFATALPTSLSRVNIAMRLSANKDIPLNWL